MCEFCESIKDRNKKIIWNVRNTMADNNICEYVNDVNCELCDRCDMHFKLYGYDYKGNTMVSVEYKQIIKDSKGNEVIIWPFTESVQFNYCPFCGQQISKEVLDFEKCTKYSLAIDIEED